MGDRMRRVLAGVVALALLAGLDMGVAGAAAPGARLAHRGLVTTHHHPGKGWKKINHWMRANAKTRHVDITVIAAADNTNGGFNFDGYAKGQANFVVPLGWKVKIIFSNHASGLPHSLGIASSHGSNPQIPRIGGKQVQVSDPTTGITGSRKVKLTFTARPAAKYFFVCEVPGHDLGGMWDHFTIKKGAREPLLQVH